MKFGIIILLALVFAQVLTNSPKKIKKLRRSSKPEILKENINGIELKEYKINTEKKKQNYDFDVVKDLFSQPNTTAKKESGSDKSKIIPILHELKDDTGIQTNYEKSKTKDFLESLRSEYHSIIDTIDSEISKPEYNTKEKKAKAAFKIRHGARLLIRKKMNESSLKNYIISKSFNIRDYLVYGNIDGPNFEYLVKSIKAKATNLTMDEIYEKIIESAKRTNELINYLSGHNKDTKSDSLARSTADFTSDSHLNYSSSINRSHSSID